MLIRVLVIPIPFREGYFRNSIVWAVLKEDLDDRWNKLSNNVHDSKNLHSIKVLKN